METLGQRVLKRRDELGWTQEDLEFESKVHINTISKIERNEATPTIKILCQLASTLKVPFYYLMPNDSLEILANNPADLAYRELCDSLYSEKRIQAIKTIIKEASAFYTPE